MAAASTMSGEASTKVGDKMHLFVFGLGLRRYESGNRFGVRT